MLRKKNTILKQTRRSRSVDVMLETLGLAAHRIVSSGARAARVMASGVMASGVMASGVMASGLAAAGVVASVGCTPPMVVGLRPMLKEAEENQFATRLKYGGERVVIMGDVSVLSVHKQQEWAHEYSVTGAKSSRQPKNMPYVYLVPGDDQSGRALCFFPQDDYHSAARVQKGQRLTLECSFQEYVTNSNDQVLVFNSCEIP